MGPQPLSRGNSHPGNPSLRANAYFNGAATSQSRKPAAPCRSSRRAALQWGRNLSVAETRRGRSQLRIYPTLLQWGRNLSVAETLSAGDSAPSHKHFNGAATSQSRKQPLTRRSQARVRGDFNGAATSQSRKLESCRVNAQKPDLTSMGPQPLSRGNYSVPGVSPVIR